MKKTPSSKKKKILRVVLVSLAIVIAFAVLFAWDRVEKEKDFAEEDNSFSVDAGGAKAFYLSTKRFFEEGGSVSVKRHTKSARFMDDGLAVIINPQGQPL